MRHGARDAHAIDLALHSLCDDRELLGEATLFGNCSAVVHAASVTIVPSVPLNCI